MPDPRYIDRPPRIQPELPKGVVDIPNPPKEDENQQPLWQAAVPIVTILGYVLVSASGQGSNIAFMIPMALAVFISTGLTLYNTINGWQVKRLKREAYTRRLVEMRREMAASHNRQRTFYEYNYPEPAVVLEMKGDRRDNRGGSRLWERRTSDEDFGVVRIGKGVRESTVEYKVSQKGENDENPLTADAERLAADSRFVADVPITIPLYQIPAQKKKEKTAEDSAVQTPITVKHTLGIAGEPQDVYEFVYSLLVHYGAFHSPADVFISILGMNETAGNWSWLYSLPHSQINTAKGHYRLYFEDCERIISPVNGTIEEICVKVGKSLEAGEVVARIRPDSGRQAIDIISPIAGRVQEFGRLRGEADENPPVIDVGKHVEAGMALMRLEDFNLTAQQLEEELDPRKGLQELFGKARKREVAGVPRFWKEKIWVELDRRARRLRDKDENDNTNITLPFMLNVVDLLAAKPEFSDKNNPLKHSYLDDLESEAAMSLLVGQGAQLGSAIIFLVPQRSKIPSGCQSIIELKRDADGVLKFLYAETGVNTTRYVGIADTIVNPENVPNRKLLRFAKNLAEWEMRRSFGADIPRSVGLLPLYDANTIEQLGIPERWRESKDPKRAEWPKIPLGMLAGQEPRYLHFFADADGVHGMIAGSTGSGKSELLMTLILSLAVKYDPMMVNFVLIDFKGGAAFEPFKDLPHVVDIVTNLRGNAVARMFAAINAELNRRQQVNQDNDTKDIVRYRKNGLHLSQDDNYPHLFIIIDEFAEMIANNPEYKAQLDSITRLGRALGVSLILAAQRPTGVTDQMRANIKFRICLRVETREESSELLRLPDASYLPSIPGRGYLQVGSESLELIQVGYTGETYLREDYDPYERYANRRIIWESELGKEEDEPTYDVLVRRMADMANKIYKTPANRKWRKPWPNPLPTYLSLDQPDGIEVDYLLDEDFDSISGQLEPGQSFVLAPAIPQWLSGQLKDWKGIDWENRAMRAAVGLMDDPSNAKLHLLKVDLRFGHHVIFGASGWGKSMFLRTLITSLVATHAPDELHLYILDFGNRSLRVFSEMPHTGAYIVAHETERVERLMRLLEQTIDERKTILSQANVANISEYNLKILRRRANDLAEVMPAILVVIDNFAEMKDSYEMQLEVLASLMREGLSNGVHFVVTGEQSNAVGKLFNLITERITLRLSDEGEYSTIVGRGARTVDEIPGRGLRRVDRSPLELQVAMPLAFIDDEDAKSEADRLIDFLNILKQAAKDKNYTQPPQVDILETWAVLPQLLEEYRATAQWATSPMAQIVLGRTDYDLSPETITLDQKPHFIVTGPPSSGKTTALQTWILALADSYPPEKVALVMIDYQGGLVDYGGNRRLDELPHALQPIITEAQQLTDVMKNLENEFLNTPDRPLREVFVIIDNYDDMDELAPRSGAEDVRKRLGDMARRCGKQGLHFVICGMRESLASSDELVRPISANRYGLAMDAETAESAPFYASVPRSYSQMQLPRGRGFVVLPGKVTLVQVAVPYTNPAFKTEEMDTWVQRVLDRSTQRAAWLPMAEADSESPNENGANSTKSSLTAQERQAIITEIETRQGLPAGTLADSFAALDDESLISTAQGMGVNLPVS